MILSSDSCLFWGSRISCSPSAKDSFSLSTLIDSCGHEWPVALTLSQRFQRLQNRVSFLPPTSLPWVKRRKNLENPWGNPENYLHSWWGKPHLCKFTGGSPLIALHFFWEGLFLAGLWLNARHDGFAPCSKRSVIQFNLVVNLWDKGSTHDQS